MEGCNVSSPHDALLCVCRPNGEVRPMEVLEFYDLIESKRMARLEQLVQKQKSIESPLIKVRPCQTSLEDSSHAAIRPVRRGMVVLTCPLLWSCLVLSGGGVGGWEQQWVQPRAGRVLPVLGEEDVQRHRQDDHHQPRIAHRHSAGGPAFHAAPYPGVWGRF